MFRDDKMENTSNWRRDGPLPDNKKVSEPVDKRTSRPSKVDNDSVWRRSGPPPEFNREQRDKSFDKSRSSVARSENNEAHDKTDRSSTWRRASPLETKNERKQPEKKSENKPFSNQDKFGESSISDFAGSWRKKSDSIATNTSHSLKHERSSVTSLNAKSSRIDENNDSKANLKASVKVVNSFGILSNVRLVNNGLY